VLSCTTKVIHDPEDVRVEFKYSQLLVGEGGSGSGKSPLGGQGVSSADKELVPLPGLAHVPLYAPPGPRAVFLDKVSSWLLARC
jgi:hypothetical protein